MAYTVAITNQKGGVGKTTTAVNLAASLAIAERRTLLVDADPQGNTTSGVGIAKVELQVSLYDVLVDEHPVHDVVLPVPGLRHLSVLPATQDLVGAELQLIERPFRESALRRVLEPLEHEYDYIVVDCPPSLGLLTLNVLAAVQQLIIPIQCEYYGLEGISQLLNTVRLVQQNINPGLAIGGVLLTMYDSRLNLCRQVAEDATEYFGPKVFGTPIPRNVRLAEAPSFGKPILLYDVQSVGAKSYLAVAQELLRRVEGTDVTIAPAQVAAAAAHAAAAATAFTAPPPEIAEAEVPLEEEAAAVEAATVEAATVEAVSSETVVVDESAVAAPVEEVAPPEQAAPEQFAAEDVAAEEYSVREQVPEELASQEDAPLDRAPQEVDASAAVPSPTMETPTETIASVETDEATPVSNPDQPLSEESLPPPEAELERLDGDRSHQATTDHVEPLIVTAAPNGTDAVPSESAGDEATRLSHPSESKPEVTT
jgi:chromosome partitioning protein